MLWCFFAQGQPVQLREGSLLRFAASSREYVLRHAAAADTEAQHHSTAPATAAEPPVRSFIRVP